MKLENINIENKDGVMVVSSREVAINFGKEHSKVIRSIENYQNRQPSQNWLRYFMANEYKDAKGEIRKEYLLTRDGFSFLVMGFTGRKADEWKLKYIDAFNKMEKHIKSNPQALPTNFKEALQQLLVEVEEKEQLQIELKQLEPKAKFAETIVASDTSIDIGSFAKLLKQNGIDIGRTRLFRIFRKHGYLMSNGRDTVPTQKSMNLKVMETRVGNCIINDQSEEYLTPMITSKGQVYFMGKFMKGELA